MTQQELTLTHWIEVRNAAASYTVWRFAQARIDALFRAMGYPTAPAAVCQLVDEERIFPAVRAALDGDGEGRRGGWEKGDLDAYRKRTKRGYGNGTG